MNQVYDEIAWDKRCEVFLQWSLERMERHRVPDPWGSLWRRLESGSAEIRLMTYTFVGRIYPVRNRGRVPVEVLAVYEGLGGPESSWLIGRLRGAYPELLRAYREW